MTSDHAPLVDRIRAALEDEPSTREVRMFDSLAFMVHEQMLVAAGKDDDLLVRIDPGRHRELLARPGAQQAEMGTGRPMGPSWIRVGREAIAADADLSFWIDVAWDYHTHTRKASS
ncbi:TfoX/Sxy family protein [Phytoactinopolyspora halotolerans]|uniref:TfoX/Sxy family protein n=1 Tax=Phytoactinopolyspora halotolerans TaxID=1981512 RepID=A0A6L9SAM6_9ACTN|nr:TfoX/Sxy family protein [Phytoactinopolyspora halotolerans]NEE01040.1 TfoX/Sxy family protein [Phytoactinopolyspora halotolerans]